MPREKETVAFARQIVSRAGCAVEKAVAAGVVKGTGTPSREKVGKVTPEQVRQIAETKMADLNAITIDAAMRIIAGTARSMGIEITN